MNKQYQHNGKNYSLKPITLGVMKNVLPFLAKLRKMQHEYTKDIDMEDVEKERRILVEFETAKEQLSTRSKEEVTEEERISIADKLKKLDEKIAACKSGLNQNDAFRQKIKLFNECTALAFLDALSEKELASRAMEAVLECVEDPAGKLSGVDFNVPGTLKFLMKVITDFFLLIQTTSLKSSA